MQPPYEDLDDDAEDALARKTVFGIVPEPTVVLPSAPLPVAERESRWTEMRVARTAATVIAVVLILAATVLAVKALPWTWAWLPCVLAFLPFGMFVAWAFQTEHDANEAAKRRAENAAGAAFKLSAAPTAPANPNWSK